MPIDVEDDGTWPPALRALVDHFDASTRWSDYASDLEVNLGLEDDLRDLLTGERLLPYHATRLLPHEVAMIRSQGPRIFSRDLFDEKLEAARHHEALSTPQAAELRGGYFYGLREEDDHGLRTDQVCLVIGKSVFRDDAHGVEPLLSHWGGEGIYWSPGNQDPQAQQLLCSLGCPAVVVAALPIAAPRTDQLMFPPLPRVLLAARRGLDRASCDVFHRAAIAPENILHLVTRPPGVRRLH